MKSGSVQRDFGRCDWSFEQESYLDAEGYVHIYNLYILPESRRQGKAREILQTAINEIRGMGHDGEILIVACPTEDSISKEKLSLFYEKMGLKVFECYKE